MSSLYMNIFREILFFKPLNTDLWIIQPQKAPYWTNTVSTYKGQPDKANFST